MDTVETNLITLSRHVLHDQSKHKEATGDLTLLLASIQLGCKFVSSLVRKAGLANLTGLAGNIINIQGEEVKKLDVLANEIFINSLQSSGKVCAMVSEENESVIQVDPKLRGKYIVVFDPLDGSSNIDAGVPVGTIFGIYAADDALIHNEGDIAKEDILRPGRDLIAAGYAMYGSFTTLVLTTGHGVNGYTLDPSLGEFILTNPNMTVPKRGKIYSVNEANQSTWEEPVYNFFSSLKQGSSSKPTHSSRYIGSMVADVHRTLLYGGIFAYPADRATGKGKLRLLYECFPMSMLLEQAGGRAIDSQGKRILDVVPSGIHDRSAIVLGSPDNIEEFLSFL